MQFVLEKPELGQWRAGNTGVEGVWQFDSGKPGRSVMVIALVHGNELCGAWALKTLLEARFRPFAGKLTLAFCVVAGFDRFDAAHHDASRYIDVDMNRVWSDDKLATPSTQERRRAVQLRPYVEQADWPLDLHSMHEPGEPLLLTGLQARNLALARQPGAQKHIVVDAGHQEGVRMRDYGHFGSGSAIRACALLVECGFHGDASSKDVAIDMAGRFLMASGVVDTARVHKDWLQPTPKNQIAVKVTDLRQLRAGVTVVRLAQRVELYYL